MNTSDVNWLLWSLLNIAGYPYFSIVSRRSSSYDIHYYVYLSSVFPYWNLRTKLRLTKTIQNFFRENRKIKFISISSI